MHHATLTPDKALCPIVAIHGSASNGQLWDKLFGKENEKRTVLAPDLAGYGHSDSRETNLNSSLEKRAEPIVESTLALKRSVHLVAHSFGASVALEIIRQIPDQVESVTLYEPVAPALLRDSGAYEDTLLLGDLLALSELVGGTTGMTGMETFVNFWSGPQTWEKLPGCVRQTLADYAPVVYQDFIEAYHNLCAGKLSAVAYKGPVKLIMGEQTIPHARRMASLFCQQFPQAVVEVLDRLGHMGPLTHSSTVHPRILQHIESVEAMCSLDLEGHCSQLKD